MTPRQVFEDSVLRLLDYRAGQGGEITDEDIAEILAAGDQYAAAAGRELLEAAEQALTRCWKAALTVKPTLDVPYPDAPETSPWAKFAEPAARRAHDLAMRLRKHLRESP